LTDKTGDITMDKQDKKPSAINLVDFDPIVRASISKAFKDEGLDQDLLDEAYVATQKPYNQVSEFVSQRTKNVHTELYKSYVAALNRVSAELDSAHRDEADSKHSEFRSLKLDETYNMNAVWLHECYFANCFDPHSEISTDSMAYMRLERDFGTFSDWQRDFIACAMACGNGWACSGYNMFLKRYQNVMISNNSQDVPLGFYPLIVVDCIEHSYLRDYNSDKKSYVIAMMRELNWNVINERFQRAEGINEVVK